ncbi:hypothetical protein OIE68_39525 [Nocardia vinacea]|uniref:hypothetical protein n=1 Tax=Nocardia vinacea TaxID=96468 RepID=UPI002E0FC17E|nr:hypothetical protein OIE68_39525 [Nocardia vinacea]
MLLGHEVGGLRQGDEVLLVLVESITRAFIQAVAGDAALIAADLEEAGTLAAAAVINGDGLRSARYLRYLSDFHNQIPAGATRHPALAEFVDLMHTHYPAIVAPQQR